MNHHQIEKDIEHLEHLLPQIATADRPLPLSYWQDRVNNLTSAARLPAQLKRVQKLTDALRTLEARQSASPHAQEQNTGTPAVRHRAASEALR
ncbi:hypothetical protein P3T43_002924 [Paraburkholderia sp. GAS41]|jgi:hypothetical protein|uniref:hypothetical protein n=1 Tax=Paraburkholderia sp. GAS41 TaxID=3035134 RepID=UPI003D1F2573